MSIRILLLSPDVSSQYDLPSTTTTTTVMQMMLPQTSQRRMHRCVLLSSLARKSMKSLGILVSGPPMMYPWDMLHAQAMPDILTLFGFYKTPGHVIPKETKWGHLFVQII